MAVRLCSLLVTALLTFTGCSYFTNVGLLLQGSMETTAPTTLPFTYVKQLIIVDAQIGAERGSFILDTAAFDSKIEQDFAQHLDLPTVTTKNVSTAQGLEQRLPVTQLPSVQLGQAEFVNTSAGILEYGEDSASQCVAPQGLLGANLMRRGYWKIDYRMQEITLHDEPLPLPDMAYELQFTHPTLSATPSISLNVGGKTVEGVLFDTGYNGGLVLPLALASEFASDTTLAIADRSTSGIFGANEDQLLIKDLSIELAGMKATIPVEFSQQGKALLGNDVLEHFDLYLDYTDDRIHLMPRSDIEVSPPRRFIPGITVDDRWIVNRTEEANGLALGTMINTINGQKPSELFSDFCDYFLHLDRILGTKPLTLEMASGETRVLP
ncbi:aspartyl protease family protein [Salinispirillum marinum]|uniref:Aspartyl protease family protein n=2 Tax=Saccharospirillaceae TaxID=255527 RepID=A0ABV8BE73_9GAMM